MMRARPLAMASPPDPLRELHEALRELTAAVNTLNANLTRGKRQLPASEHDDHRLMLAMAATVRGTFTAADLWQHARLHDDLAAALLGVASHRQLGKRLAQLVDRHLAGFVVRRVGRDASGTIWEMQVAHLHTQPHGVADDGA